MVAMNEFSNYFCGYSVGDEEFLSIIQTSGCVSKLSLSKCRYVV